mmetsp:Transcript_129790/g.416461  ORF Transcript_129790/g.416461 Transcript_129790/m.416461 type:complete len:257 (+) Transcript_129790:839-1609(+)
MPSILILRGLLEALSPQMNAPCVLMRRYASKIMASRVPVGSGTLALLLAPGRSFHSMSVRSSSIETMYSPSWKNFVMKLRWAMIPGTPTTMPTCAQAEPRSASVYFASSSTSATNSLTLPTGTPWRARKPNVFSKMKAFVGLTRLRSLVMSLAGRHRPNVGMTMVYGTRGDCSVWGAFRAVKASASSLEATPPGRAACVLLLPLPLEPPCTSCPQGPSIVPEEPLPATHPHRAAVRALERVRARARAGASGGRRGC